MDYRKPQKIITVQIDKETICLRPLGAKAWIKLQEHEGQSIDLVIYLIQQSICDEDGNLIYTPEDIPAMLDNMPLDHVEVLSEKIDELNGMSKKN